MALYAIDKKPAYYDYAKQWGDKHNWGLVSGVETRNADNHCAGQTYLDMYAIDKNPVYIKDLKTSIDHMVASDKVDDWWWIDALQMAMPVFVKLGALYNDTAYYGKMYRLYADAKYRQGGQGLVQYC